MEKLNIIAYDQQNLADIFSHCTRLQGNVVQRSTKETERIDAENASIYSQSLYIKIHTDDLSFLPHTPKSSPHNANGHKKLKINKGFFFFFC